MVPKCCIHYFAMSKLYRTMLSSAVDAMRAFSTGDLKFKFYYAMALSLEGGYLFWVTLGLSAFFNGHLSLFNKRLLCVDAFTSRSFYETLSD